jgi:hypothetical protein
MPRHRQLFRRREDPHALVGAGAGAGDDERALRKIHLAGEHRHEGVGDVAGVVEDGELVAFEGGGREDVDL